MSALLLGLAPVFALIAMGYGLRKSGFLPDETWRPIEKLSINLLYPGFLIPAIWNADLIGGSASAAGGAAVVSVIVVSIAALALKPLMTFDGPAYTSVFQGVIRWNSFVFLPVVQSLFGAPGLAVGAVMIACIIPVTNISCVAVLARWGRGQKGVRPLALLKAMASNPILLACLIGLVLNLSGAPRLPGLTETLALLGGAALPMGLIVAGAGLSFAAVARSRTTIAAVSVVKLILMPPLMWGLCRWFGGDALAQAVALLCGATPGAAASYMLARQMGGDAPLMAGIIAATTVASVVTIPILMALFHLS